MYYYHHVFAAVAIRVNEKAISIKNSILPSIPTFSTDHVVRRWYFVTAIWVCYARKLGNSG